MSDTFLDLRYLLVRRLRKTVSIDSLAMSAVSTTGLTFCSFPDEDLDDPEEALGGRLVESPT